MLELGSFEYGWELSGGKNKCSISLLQIETVIGRLTWCKECLIPSARRLFGRFVGGPCLAITDFEGLSPRSDCLPDRVAIFVDLVYVQILWFLTRQKFFALRRQHLDRNLCFDIEPIDGTTVMKGIVEFVLLEVRLQIRARLGRLRESTKLSLPLLGLRATSRNKTGLDLWAVLGRLIVPDTRTWMIILNPKGELCNIELEYKSKSQRGCINFNCLRKVYMRQRLGKMVIAIEWSSSSRIQRKVLDAIQLAIKRARACEEESPATRGAQDWGLLLIERCVPCHQSAWRLYSKASWIYLCDYQLLATM